MAPGSEIPRGTGPPTGVPPAASVIVALGSVMVVLAVGIAMARVVFDPTNVSDTAIEGGYGLGSVDMEMTTDNKYERNKSYSTECGCEWVTKTLSKNHRVALNSKMILVRDPSKGQSKEVEESQSA